MTGSRCAAPLQGVEGDDLDLVYYYTLVPNLFVSLHPDYVLIHRSVPQAVDKTHILCDWYFHPDAIALEISDMAPDLVRAGIETGPLATWLWGELKRHLRSRFCAWTRAMPVPPSR